MNPEEIEQIKRETSSLLEEFSKALAKVKSEEENVVIRDKDRRTEKQGTNQNEKFRQIMFDNASQKNKDFIIAEKKSW